MRKTPLHTFLVIICSVPSLAFAVDRFVTTTGNDVGGTNNCATQASPCLTISNAVTQANASGDRILVGAGTYTLASPVIVNKTLDLRGAQADVDARTRNAPGGESILSGVDGAFNVTADGVVINGFTIQDQTAACCNAAGILFPDGTDDYQLINNIVQNNIFGVYANTGATGPGLIQFNLFQNNNNPGAASGNGVYGDFGSHSLTVDSNLFINNSNCGATFDIQQENNTDLTFTNNRFEQANGGGICVFNTDGILVENNQIVDSVVTGVTLSLNITDAVVQNNLITGSGTQAVRVGSNGSAGTQSNVAILGNQIIDNAGGILLGSMATQSGIEVHFNRIFNNQNFGLDNAAANGAAAENNWWGCNVGPNDAAGDCDIVSGPADFDPWLILRLLPNPSAIGTGQSSDLLSDLTQNSDGVDTAALGNIPDDTPVGFSASFGSVTPANSVTTSGQSSSVFNPGSTTGNAQVCTTVDNQTVCTDITVDSTPPPPPPPPPFVGCLQGSGVLSGTGAANCQGLSCSLVRGISAAPSRNLLLLSMVLFGLWAAFYGWKRSDLDKA